MTYTQEQREQIRPIVEAWLDGKEIEFCDQDRKWSSAGSSVLGLSPDRYRIKPEPRSWWIKIYKGNILGIESSRGSFLPARLTEPGIEYVQVFEKL